MANRSLSELKNIGKTVAAKLHEIGITNEAELKKLGAAKANKWLSDNTPTEHRTGLYSCSGV